MESMQHGKAGKSTLLYVRYETICDFGQREVTDPTLPRKASKFNKITTVLQTNSGGRVENTKAFERTVIKELGKLQP